ncbi:hypothetical protein LUW10_20935 [Pseudomonas veronii]|uniref:hypothetical protein n=1 Tax=Pseudomonas veronii TaxID=76761 RepID=UPI001E4C231E|nr:hypothetical protein [Pseudomonas veronii]UHH28325.1 hypothetical protein LUW10_20935 [Pseudomonas veronii]
MKKIQPFALAAGFIIAASNSAQAEPLVVPPHTEVLGFHLGMSDCDAAAIDLSRSHREMSRTLSSEVPATYFLLNVNGNGFDVPGLEGVSLICARSPDKLVHGAVLVFRPSATNDVLVALNSKYKRADRSDNLIVFKSPSGLINVEVFDSGLRASYADTFLINDMAAMSRNIGTKL